MNKSSLETAMSSSLAIPSSPLRGLGFSSSSVESVLRTAVSVGVRPLLLELLAGRLPPEHFRSVIARTALDDERRAAGAAIAGNDVYPIVHGGVVSASVDLAFGGMRTRVVDADSDFLSRHFFLAWNPNGKMHSVSAALSNCFSDPVAGCRVRSLSALAGEMTRNLEKQDWRACGQGFLDYNREFQAWSKSYLSPSVASRMSSLVSRAGKDRLPGWKHPGAGDAESVLLVCDGRSETISFLRSEFQSCGWEFQPVRGQGGLQVSLDTPGQKLTVSAPHRVDFIGAADLGADARIAVEGTCLACAVGPRLQIDCPFVHALQGDMRNGWNATVDRA
ncbi:MAG TPA: hypothetical protein DIT64_20285 [Verrucomicrobiales bacterium]|nr:hypothetical protein [Verrucomicrobiales bacterium]